MNTRFVLSTLTLALAAAAGGAAHAATAATTDNAAAPATAAAPAPAAPAKPAPEAAANNHAAKSHHAAKPHHTAHAGHASATDHMHQRVVLARSTEQRHWIAAGLHQQRIDSGQATSLRTSVAGVEQQQDALSVRGHETVAEALAVSHRQDVLDWAIHTGNTDFEPQQLVALS